MREQLHSFTNDTPTSVSIPAQTLTEEICIDIQAQCDVENGIISQTARRLLEDGGFFLLEDGGYRLLDE